MLEMKITITAADLAAAINNLAGALEGKALKPMAKEGAPVGSAPVAQPATGAIPVNPTTGSPSATERTCAGVAPKPKSALLSEQTLNPTPVQVAQPTAAPAIMPLTAEQTATPIVPTVPVAAPAPAVAPVAVSPANAVPTGTVPTAAPQYTIDMLATAGSSLIDAGKMDQLLQVLAKHGVASLTDIKPENYGAVATELRALGAQL